MTQDDIADIPDAEEWTAWTRSRRRPCVARLLPAATSGMVNTAVGAGHSSIG